MMPAMTPLHSQRCFHHARREAAARCPECGRFYCRECINEHQGRWLCASCLRRLTQPAVRPRHWSAVLGRGGAVLAGLLLAWLFFHGVGSLLLHIPSEFHELKADKLFEAVEE